MTSVLMCGSSIAGPALAWWLRLFGVTPVLVEKASGPRPGGHAIDVRGAALRILREMELFGAAHAKRTRMTRVSEIDRDGNELWRSEDFTISGRSFSLEAIEILRDDLSRILVAALPGDVEIRYNDSVASYEEDEAGILVRFQSGLERKFDILVGADGLTSSMRKLIFGADDGFIRPFDAAVAPFTVPNTLGLTDWQLFYKDEPATCTVYTAPGNQSLRVSFGFSAAMDDVPADRAGQIALVREKCGHMGWHVPHLLDVMTDARDFYLGSLAQVRMPHWSKGRAALIGDAAYCPSPFTGQGTSLAMVGGYVLVQSLAQHTDDHAAAFARYETQMRPFVEQNQALADLTRDERFTDPAYYIGVVEPALKLAKDAIELEGFT